METTTLLWDDDYNDDSNYDVFNDDVYHRLRLHDDLLQQVQVVVFQDPNISYWNDVTRLMKSNHRIIPYHKAL